MPIGPNERNVGRSARPGSRKSTYGPSPAKTSETTLETTRSWCPPQNPQAPPSAWLFDTLAQQPPPHPPPPATPTLHEVLTIRTGPGITDQLRHTKATRWRRRDITAKEWKANNGETEANPLVVKSSSKIRFRWEGNDQEPIQLSHIFHQIHQRERNTNTK